MANTYLIDLSPNDATQDIARKCNANFRRLAFDQTHNTNGSVRREAVRADEALAGAVAEIDIAIENAKQELNTMLVNAREEIDEQIRDILDKLENIDIAPPVGTYIYALYNPNEQWAGTTWEQVAEGNFLIAAGDTYLIGEPYGENQHTLTAAEMPSHYHYTYRNFVVDVGWHDANNNWARPRPGGGNTPWNVASSPATSSTGGSQPHNNIPQSIAVPLWKRTA